MVFLERVQTLRERFESVLCRGVCLGRTNGAELSVRRSRWVVPVPASPPGRGPHGPGWRHGMHNKDGGRQATSNACEPPTSFMSRSEQSPQHKHTTLSHTLRNDYVRSSRYIPSSFISKTPKHKRPFHRTQHCIQIRCTTSPYIVHYRTLHRSSSTPPNEEGSDVSLFWFIIFHIVRIFLFPDRKE